MPDTPTTLPDTEMLNLLHVHADVEGITLVALRASHSSLGQLPQKFAAQ